MGERLLCAVTEHWPKFRPLLKGYPKGACTGITHTIFDFLQREHQVPVYSPLQKIKSFCAAGGVFKTVWGSIRGVYFQNAMQVGSHYIDVANDTVDLTKPTTDQAPMESSGFKNIETFGEYAKVRALYVGDQIYRNNFIPNLLPYRPLVTVNHDQRMIRIDGLSEPISRIMRFGDMAAFADIAAPDVSMITSSSSIAQLAEPFAAFAQVGGLQFRFVQDLEWSAMLSQFEQLSVDERFRELKNVSKVVKLVNLVWARAKMYERVVDELVS